MTNVIPNDPAPPIEYYGVRILSYTATKIGDWRYTTRNTAFEESSELLIGLHLSLNTGTHFGWVRFMRAFIDPHSQFELSDYAIHPVPNESIRAGEQPDLPSILTKFSGDGLGLSWDPSWGNLILESTTNLILPTWEVIVEAAGGPIDVTLDEDQQFYRLRQP